MDTKDDMEIIHVDSEGYSFAIVPGTVFSVGHNSEFIIAKQHPKLNPSSAGKNITNYYIIVLNKEPSASKRYEVFGPLTDEEFRKRKEELGVKIDFSKTFTDLE